MFTRADRPKNTKAQVSSSSSGQKKNAFKQAVYLEDKRAEENTQTPLELLGEKSIPTDEVSQVDNPDPVLQHLDTDNHSESKTTESNHVDLQHIQDKEIEPGQKQPQKEYLEILDRISNYKKHVTPANNYSKDKSNQIRTKKENVEILKRRIKGLKSAPEEFRMTLMHDVIKTQDNEFLNYYSTDLALMNQNYNITKLGFNASDVFLEQYATAIKGDHDISEFKNKLPESPPKEIIRNGVVNEKTKLIVLEEVDKNKLPLNNEYTYEKGCDFFATLLETPNVKSTKHMLNDFNTINRNREPPNLQYEIKKLTVVLGISRDTAFNIIIETGEK